jgi:hypothetical protein
VYDTVFPPIDFVANDRVPNERYQILSVAEKLSLGSDVTTATKPDGKDLTSMSMQADRDEDFNTRLASYHAWRKAIEKVKPIPRTTAQLDLSAMVRTAGCKTARMAAGMAGCGSGRVVRRACSARANAFGAADRAGGRRGNAARRKP